MDIIRRYITNFNDSEDRHKSCEVLIQEFMANYSSIIYESESEFICKYFMSAILAFCADIDFQNNQLLESFLRFFVKNQSGIWDIWSIYQFGPQQWLSMESCLGFEFENVRNRSGICAMKYIIEFAHRLNIEFVDPNNESQTIRFIDFPRFNAIESKSELWRNIHLPVIDCTLLPENPNILRLILQFGALIPTIDYQIPHLVHRIRQSVTTATVNILLKKLFWIKLVAIETSHRIKLYKELSLIGNEIIETLKQQTDYKTNECLLDCIPAVPSLKQLARNSIRNNFRLQHTLPQSISELEINPLLKEYLNLNRL